MFAEGYEEFSDSQLKLLERFVTNTTSHVFALRNLPEVSQNDSDSTAANNGYWSGG